MILSSLNVTELYRAHTPRWSFAPLSGAGAAVQGGRFNRKGIEALYLTLEAKTALAEYQQVSPLLEPCMLTSYIASVGRLVDLRQFDGSDVWDPLWTDWDTDWRNFAFNLHIEPPTWVLGDLVRGAGHAGILFPSVVNSGGTNAVLYQDIFASGDSITVHDPHHDLPIDQSSWRRS